MHTNSKIPFWVAVLINTNIVIGSAFFLGAPQVSLLNGIFAPFAWIICGLLLLPLLIVLARLSRMYPISGGLYIYSLKHLGKFWGFVSGWGYYIGTAAANALVLHAFSEQLLNFNVIKNFNLSSLVLDLFFVLFFTFLNLLNIEFLERIQIGLAIIKSIPMVLVLVALPFLFNINNLFTVTPSLGGFVQTIPLALFAYIGIEACCAVADKIHDGQKNAARVILVSFALIIVTYALLQTAILCITGASPVNPFFSIIPMLTKNQTIIALGNSVINFAMAASFLAGFYGMFYYNNWNLYAMGSENSILCSKHLIRVNKSQTPWICVLFQSALVIAFLLITTNINYLMTMCDLGTTIAYFLSAISFLVIFKSFWGYLAIASCGLLLLINSERLFSAGFIYLVPFLVILGVGIIAHKVNEILKNKNQSL